MSNPVMAEMIRERNRVNKQAQRQRKKVAKDRVAEASNIPTSLPAPQGPPSTSPTSFSTVAVMTDPPAGPTTAVAVRLRQMVNMGVMTESPAASSLEKLRCKSIYRVFSLADESSTEAVASTMTADGVTAHGARGDDVRPLYPLRLVRLTSTIRFLPRCLVISPLAAKMMSLCCI